MERPPYELWTEVLKHLPDCGLFAFASTCKKFRRVQVASERKLVTRRLDILPHKDDSVVIEMSKGWCSWHSDTFLPASDGREAGLILLLIITHVPILKKGPTNLGPCH